MINPYEKMLMVMRNQGRADSQLFTGLLQADMKLDIGTLTLEPGEYSVLNGLTAGANTKVLIASVNDELIVLGKVV